MPTETLPGTEDCNCFAVRSAARLKKAWVQAELDDEKWPGLPGAAADAAYENLLKSRRQGPASPHRP
jgi:hypothetical protein